MASLFILCAALVIFRRVHHRSSGSAVTSRQSEPTSTCSLSAGIPVS